MIISSLLIVGFVSTFMLMRFIIPTSNLAEVLGIENFTLDGSEADYVLIYPADWRVSQNYTLIKEVTKSGEELKKYKIIDEDFRRAMIHQKPTDQTTLYLSLFGEPVIQNWFYTYDLKSQKFNKVPINYFTYDTGVNHIMHYGEDIIFNTIVSHKTGDQVLNPNTHDFKVSMSNYTTEKSYETEWGFEPLWSPILQFNDHIIYASTNVLTDDGTWSNSYVVMINEKDGTFKTTDYHLEPTTEFYPIYTNGEKAFILNRYGELIVLDQNFDYEIVKPYEFVPLKEQYYIHNGFLMLDEKRALQVISEHDRSVDIMGILELSQSPHFSPIEKDYLHEDRYYRILYQDIEAEVIFIIEEDYNGKGKALIIDRNSFDLIDSFPVDYPHLLDIIIKK